MAKEADLFMAILLRWCIEFDRYLYHGVYMLEKRERDDLHLNANRLIKLLEDKTKEEW